MVQTMHHLGLCVTNMDAMIPFYEEILGMEKTEDFSMTGTFLDTVQGKEDMDYRIVKFTSPEGVIVELLQDRGHDTLPQTSNSLQAAGLRHFAFTVHSVDKAYEIIKKAGYDTISEPCTSEDGSMRLFFARDPEQNLVEIMQLYEHKDK